MPELGGNWQLALGCVFVSGVLFFALSLSLLRVWLIDAIPMSLKLGIAAGIGFFLALIALQNAGVVVDDPVTLVTLGDLLKPQTWLAAAGFLLIAGLAVRKLPGAIIAGVLAVTVAAVALGLEPWHGIAAVPPSLAPTFLQMDLAGVFQLGLVTIVLTLLLVTILDTAGTLIGVARQAGFLAAEGRLPRARADDAQLFDRHRHRPRLHRLCGVKALSGRAREVNAAVAIIVAAFLLKLIFA